MSVASAHRGSRLSRVLVLLAPFAALLGMYLISRYSTAAGLELTVSRKDVARIAREHAAAKGVNAVTWRDLVDLQPDNDLRHYLQLSATPSERAAIERVVSPVAFRGVLENATNNADSVHVSVSPAGRLVSYRVPPTAASTRGRPSSEAQARQAAEEELQRRLGADRAGFAAGGSGVRRHESTGSEVRRFTFRRPYSKDLAVEATVETSGATVIGFDVDPEISPERSKRFPELGQTVQAVRGGGIALLVLGGLIYVVARFVRRLREQEIPLKRTAIVAALVFVAFASTTFLTSESQRIAALERGAATGAGFDVVLLILVATVMATLVAITWGACEADLREAYPEKLTSTDALLGGLFTTRAVRSSVANGLTIAAWAILFAGLEPFLRRAIGGWATFADGERMPFQTELPGLVVVLFAFTGVPVLMGTLMAAVSITHRSGRTRNAQIALSLLMLSFFAISILGNHTPMAWTVVQAVLSAAILLVPFLAGDLLAVVVATAVSTWAASSALLIAQPAATFRTGGWTMIALLAVLAGAAAIAASRKRDAPGAVEAEAARPEYARNISERLLLKTEMDAARAAQLRVMPRIVPQIGGVRLAAKHSESAGIGSDYYEFFSTPGHVSVAVADARLSGLSSALCVSMLKGLLLNYAARLTSPRDIADRVHRQLSAIFGDDLPLSFFFGRLDRVSGQFLFASFGDIPHAVVVTDGNIISLEGEEQARLAGGTVVIYTAPFAELRDRDGATLGDDALREELAAAVSDDPQSLVDALFGLAARHSRGVETPQSCTAVAMSMALQAAPEPTEGKP